MEYEIIGGIPNGVFFSGAARMNADATAFDQNMTFNLGIVGELYGAKIEGRCTVENIPLSLGDEIPAYVFSKVLEYIAVKYPNY